MADPILNLVDKTKGINRTDLARQIQATIRNFTHGRPMPQTEVIAVMAFITGVAVGNQPDEVDRHQMMRMVGEMVANGEESTRLDRVTQVIDVNAIRH